MQTNDPIISLAAEYLHMNRTLAYMRCNDTRERKQNQRTESKLFRAKPTSYRGARVMVDLVRRELALWEHEHMKSLAERLKRPVEELRSGGHQYSTWTSLDLVVQYLKKLLPYHPAFRRLRRALRAVCDFIKAEGGRPDPRKFSIRVL